MSMILLGGALLSSHLLHTPELPITARILACYLLGSLGWSTYAVAEENYFLATSAGVNVFIYMTSIISVHRSGSRRRTATRIPVKFTDSETSLSSFRASGGGGGKG